MRNIPWQVIAFFGALLFILALSWLGFTEAEAMKECEKTYSRAECWKKFNP